MLTRVAARARRAGARRARARRARARHGPAAFALAALVAIGVPAAARAQVGHAPGHSPYHDFPNGNSFTLLVGHFGGGGGEVGVGPHNATTYGLRFDIRTAKAVQFGIGLSRGTFDRLLIDPFQPVAQRVSGPIDQKVMFAELDIQLNLTGGKTWHRLAPFGAITLGGAFSEKTPADTSGFKFGNRFFFAPNAGVRIFVTRRLHLRGEARAVLWKLSYPANFRMNPTPVLADVRQSEWTMSPWFQAGLGYTF
ncbi:MAG TPA: hypothetical protein VFW66_02265 [Gemmatimonadales bacterium]|nr:hypothetical protein [Gemmatimonadales bacterium]